DSARDLNASKTHCTLSNFHEFLNPTNHFLRRLTSLFIRPKCLSSWLKGDCLFYIDANNALDIIDYWNLRASGWRVIPVPRQAADQEGLRKIILEFIESNYAPYRFNPKIYHFTTL